MHWNFLHSLRTRLIVFIVLLMVALLGLELANVSARYQQRAESELRGKTEFVQAVRSGFMNYVQSLWTTELALGTAIALQEPSMSTETIEALLKAQMAEHPTVINFGWFSPDGRGLANSLPDPVASIAEREYFQRLVKGEEMVVSDVIESLKDNKITVVAARSIRREGRLVGVMVARLDLTKLGQVLPSEVSSKPNFGLGDRQGMIVYRNTDPHLPMSRRQMNNEGPAPAALKSRTPVIKEYRSAVDGVTRMGVAVPIEPIGWVSFAAAPVDELYLPVKVAQTQDFLSLAAIAIGALVTPVLIANGLQRPIRAFREAAITVGRGDFTAKVDVRGAAELASVGEAFNQMADSLRERTEAERRHYIAELEQTNGKLASLIENMAEGVLAIDDMGKVMVVNPAAAHLLGLSGQVLGRPVGDVGLPAPLVEALQCVGRKAPQDPKKMDFAHGTLHFDAYVSVVPTSEDQRYGAIALFQDVTAAVQFRRLQESFVSNVSHELRGPLATISVTLEAFRDGVIPEGARFQYLHALLAETSRMQRLTNDLLDLSRLDSGNLEIICKPFDLGLILQMGETAWGLRCNAAGIDLQVDHTSVKVNADYSRVEQVINNLLQNAIKFTPDGGKIHIYCTREGKQVRVHVEDTGIGIAAEHVPYVWERFYMVDKARTRSSESGTGLGLAICKELVERMGGEVGLTSEPSRGSIFSFTQPIA